MITKCRFCDFKRQAPLSLDILRVLCEEDLPQEDSILWMRRLIEVHGFKDWHGVKIHMGRMHKQDAYYGMWPNAEFEPLESEIINRYYDRNRTNQRPKTR